MKLVDDWKVITKKAWSMRFAVLGALIGVAEQIVPGLQGQIGSSTYAALFTIVALARVIQQEVISGERKE